MVLMAKKKGLLATTLSHSKRPLLNFLLLMNAYKLWLMANHFMITNTGCQFHHLTRLSFGLLVLVIQVFCILLESSFLKPQNNLLSNCDNT